MSLGLVTIAALFFLLPGVAFIVGVNVADKNVREIVFRNTPAEIGYVVFVSVIVHLLFSPIPTFNATILFTNYECMSHPAARAAAGCSFDQRALLAVSLGYVLLASFVGFLPGWGLGLSIRSQVRPWTNAFVKHRWMLDLTTRSPDVLIYARVVLKDTFKIESGTEDRPVIVKGAIRDVFFSADGTLLYLILKNFQAENDQIADERGIVLVPRREGVGTSSFFIEGKNVTFATFYTQRFLIEETERDLAAAGVASASPS